MSFIELLYKALTSPYGIVVRTSDVKRLQAKLYAERKAAQDPALDGLSFTPSRTNPAEELWIVVKRKG